MVPQLPDRFEIVRSLGEGGMGVVYEVLDRVRGEHVALKTLRYADADAIYRLKREFRALANLEHPNLVRLYDLFADGQTCFFTMELVQGVDLATFVRSVRSDECAETIRDDAATAFNEELLRHAFAGLARGVGALHDAGLLHRDLKPSNVLVTRQERVVVLDFGLVADAHAAVQQTKAGGVTGTVAYMAPEQARGESELTTAVDLYAIGAILFELLTLQLPYEGHPLRVLTEKQTKDAPRPSTVSKGVPSDLDELCVALLARDPSARPSLSEVRRAFDDGSSPSSRSSSSSRSAGPVLVGRDEELARLDALFRRSHAGRPAVALVRGRSGIGKSALLAAFARRTERDGHAVVFAGRCHESETVPYKGLDGVVDALSRHLAMAKPEEIGRLLPPDLGDLATVFPVLRRIKPIASAYARRALVERDAPLVRAKGFACLRELLRRIAETSALVVVIDDVQWADADTARGLVELLRDEHAPSMLLLVGTRPTDASPVVQALFAPDAGDSIRALERAEIELGPLAPEALRTLATRELGPEAPRSVVEVVIRDSRGSPFAAAELVRFVRDHDATLESFGTTSSIDDLVRRRAATLDESSRRVLDVLCVAGEPTAAEFVLRAAGLAEEDRSPIDRLRVRHWIRTVRVGSGTVLETAHDRLREAVGAALDEATRRELHRRLAESFEGLESPPHDRLARHFAAAGEGAVARLHAASAAEEAAGSLAFQRAAELYALALELSAEHERSPWLAPYAEALGAAGRYADAARAWLEASSRASGTDAREPKRRAAECLLYAGRIDEGLDVLDELAGELGVRIPQHRVAVFWELVKWQFRLAIRGFGFRIRPASEIRKSDLDRVRTLGAIALQYGPLDPFRGVVPALRYLLSALELGDLDELTTAVGWQALLRAALGWRGGTMRLIELLEELATRQATARNRAWTLMARSMLDLFTGDRESAKTSAARSFVEIASIPSPPAWLLSLAHYVEGFSTMSELSPAAFERVVAFVLDREERSGPCSELRLRACAIQVHHLLVGRPENMLAFVADSRWSSATKRDITFRTIAEELAALGAIYLGDLEKARALGERVRASFRQQGAWWIPSARGQCLAVLGASGLALGDTRLVRRCLRERSAPPDDLTRSWNHLIASLAACAEGRDAQLRSELGSLRALGAARNFPLFEALACWVLGRIEPGAAGDEPRARYLAIVEGRGIVDPDLFFWAYFPVGPRPPRTGLPRSGWSEERARVVEPQKLSA